MRPNPAVQGTLGHTSMIASPALLFGTSFRKFALACIGHALIVFALWAAMFWANAEFVPVRPWLVLAWLWLAWPVVLALHPERSFLRVIVPVAIGLVAFAPCATTVFAFTVWLTRGFAP